MCSDGYEHLHMLYSDGVMPYMLNSDTPPTRLPDFGIFVPYSSMSFATLFWHRRVSPNPSCFTSKCLLYKPFYIGPLSNHSAALDCLSPLMLLLRLAPVVPPPAALDPAAALEESSAAALEVRARTASRQASELQGYGWRRHEKYTEATGPVALWVRHCIL